MEYVPAAHGVQLVRPGPAAMVPGAHTVQLAPGVGLTEPAGHCEHEPWPGMLKVPAAQFVHDPAALPLFLPLAQSVHVDCDAVEKRPAVQSGHAVRAAFWYLPATHV